MKKQPFPIKQINTLDLSLNQHGVVYSNDYGDIYFQPGIGLDEKKHIFLDGNNLPKNWQAKQAYTIAETGFGTGLNFLNTLALWHKTTQKDQHLHYVSCELHPLNQQQLQTALANFPSLTQYSRQLIDQYPQYLLYGFHRIHFKQWNVTLTLIFAEAVDAFEQLDATVDTWFLDGFSPNKNPNMWSTHLFKAIARLSHIGTTMTTFTVAKKIRDGLSANGFAIKTTTGFGQKREMLTAKLVTKNKIITKQPWAPTFKATNRNSFTVLGAGIAGLSIAQKLHQQGKCVTLIDRQKQPCLETSGNPQAMIMPAFTLNDSIEARFYLSAFLYAIRHYSGKYYHPVGVYELAFTQQQQIWQNKLLSRFNLPQDIVHKYKNGILYPQAGWLDTQGHAANIMQQLNNYFQVKISKIQYHDNQWHLYNNDEIVHATDVLILANGINVKQLLSDYTTPIIPKHGQISYFRSADIDTQIADCKHIQLNKGYITPNWNGIQTIGATFDDIEDNNCHNPPQTTKDHWQRNIQLWSNTTYADLFSTTQSHKGRAGVRVTTPDHLPVCG
ncbi:tRNA (5-methylaminomethyl-2-thiouridylate)-methyltransferase / FAD-dependent cmnm(5)s(2)U34 oxidoreductase, partial [hydrothermal vent metagenome]